MKKILFTLLIVSLNVNSQELIGEWKVTNYEDDIVYYDTSKDSISYKNLSRKNESDNFKKMYEMLIIPMKYQFKENNEYEFNHPMLPEINGTYEVYETEKYLILKEASGKSDTLPYNLNKGVLYLEMKLDSGNLKVGLEK